LWVPVGEPVEIASAYELVVERLHRAIHVRRYVPGDRLPSERKLAESLGVSRVTVRECATRRIERRLIRARVGWQMPPRSC
jgi:DNA-binding FadR family transcriptional regulator